MNLEDMLHFADPMTLFKFAASELEQLGAKRFMEGPDQRAQRAREAFAEYFFVIAQKKHSCIDWWLHQPKEIFPDFELVYFADNPDEMEFHRFELVTVPVHCREFEEALAIVNKKMTKGYSRGYNLVIFINNLNSKEWAARLVKELDTQGPFQTVWTVYLTSKSPNDIHSTVVSRIKPGSTIHIEAVVGDPEVHTQNPLPQYMETYEAEGKRYLRLNPEFQNAFRKKAKRFRLKK